MSDLYSITTLQRSKHQLNLLIASNNLIGLQSFMSTSIYQSIPIPDISIQLAIESGSLECLQYLYFHSKNFHWPYCFFAMIDTLAFKRSYEVLEFYLQHKGYCSLNVYSTVIFLSHFNKQECIKFLNLVYHYVGARWVGNEYEVAVKSSFAHIFDEDEFEEENSDDEDEFIHKFEDLNDKNNNNLDFTIVEWLYDHHCDMSTNALLTAINYNSVSMMKWLVNHGCKITSYLLYECIKNIYTFDCFVYAYETMIRYPDTVVINKDELTKDLNQMDLFRNEFVDNNIIENARLVRLMDFFHLSIPHEKFKPMFIIPMLRCIYKHNRASNRSTKFFFKCNELHRCVLDLASSSIDFDDDVWRMLLTDPYNVELSSKNYTFQVMNNKQKSLKLLHDYCFNLCSSYLVDDVITHFIVTLL
jgi:hypothetical protein